MVGGGGGGGGGCGCGGGGGGGGVLPYMGYTGCASQQGMVFASRILEQGLKISVSVCNRVIHFLPIQLWNTVGVIRLLFSPPESHCCCSRSCPIACLLKHTFSDSKVNRVAKLHHLFSLEKGQVPRHSAAHPHSKLREYPPPPPPPGPYSYLAPTLITNTYYYCTCRCDTAMIFRSIL